MAVDKPVAARPRPSEPPELRRVRLAGAVFLVVLLVGFVGYTLLTDATPLDAAYMTLITITTVGFGEIIELDPVGRAFTMGLLVSGVGAVTYGAISGAEFLVEGHLGRYIERRRMYKRIEDLDDHVVICGYGRTGRQVVDRLALEGLPYVVVEVDPRKAIVLETAGAPHLIGDATLDITLSDAGVARARAVVTAAHSDADNVMIALSARGLAPNATVFARSRTVENETKLHRAGAHHVVTPASIGGTRIAQLLARPAIAAFLDRLGDDGTDFTLEEVGVRRELDGQSLGSAELPERFGCTVLAIHHHDGTLEVQPGREAVLSTGDTLIVMGGEEDVTLLRGGRPPRERTI